jgi:release factor glutamine methyltransferase
VTIRETLLEAERALRDRGVPNARFDAELLLAQAVRQNRAWIFAHGTDPLDAGARERFLRAVARRMHREPLQYILGTQEFRGLDFLVTPSVLIPRPETEVVVEAAVGRLRKTAKRTAIIDVCTGSGCIAVAVAKELGNARIFATDRSPEALTVARENARLHDVSERIRFFEGDVFEPLRGADLLRQVDVITANPPYIPSGEFPGLQLEVRDYEPTAALVAGPKGTEIARRIIDEAAGFLTKDGLLILEMGQGQAEELKRAGEAVNAYGGVSILQDPAGIARVLVLRKR